MGQVSAKLVHERFNGSAAARLRPFIHASPPVLAGRARKPWQQVEVQVRHFVTDDRGVGVLSARDFAQSEACPRRPPTQALGLSIRKVRQARHVSPWLNKEMPKVGRRAMTPQRVGRDGMGDQNKVILGNRPTWHEGSTVTVLAAYEAIRRYVNRRHSRKLLMRRAIGEAGQPPPRMTFSGR